MSTVTRAREGNSRRTLISLRKDTFEKIRAARTFSGKDKGLESSSTRTDYSSTSTVVVYY